MVIHLLRLRQMHVYIINSSLYHVRVYWNIDIEQLMIKQLLKIIMQVTKIL